MIVPAPHFDQHCLDRSEPFLLAEGWLTALLQTVILHLLMFLANESLYLLHCLILSPAKIRRSRGQGLCLSMIKYRVLNTLQTHPISHFKTFASFC
jgi:hypothetical protein